MALAVVGDLCDITFDGADHRCYEFSINKSGTRVSCKAFVDGPGVNPELSTGVGTELVCKFRDDISQTWAINDIVGIDYTIGSSAEVVGYYSCLSIEAPVPAEGIADFSATFKYVSATAPAS